VRRAVTGRQFSTADGVSVSVSMSFGVVMRGEVAETSEQILGRARTSLQAAQGLGPGQVVFG
jgi:predicted signal transduction protein with EAL and GGDEF domain